MESKFLTLPNPLRINTAQPRIVEFDSIEVAEFRDSPTEKVISVKISEPPIGFVVLWEGAAYDQAGDWTQEDANERLVQVLQSMNYSGE